MIGQAKRHDISDWLALHELDPSICRQILHAAARQVGRLQADQEEPVPDRHEFDADLAWLSAADAMTAFFPAQRGIIDETRNKTLKVQADRHDGPRRALTLDHGPGTHPTVVYTHSGMTSDLLLLGHEFAHALQIVASGGRFVTPIVREVCAFVGEIALLSHSQATGEAQFAELRRRYRKDDHKYLRLDGKDLDLALSSSRAPYRYSWNYPIARYLSTAIYDRCPPERIWLLFEGRMTVRQVIQELDADRA